MKVFETKVTMDNVKINLIKPMTNSPFTVKDDEDTQKLRESIRQNASLYIDNKILKNALDKANKYIRRIKIVLEGLSQVYEKFKENFEKAVSVAKEYDKEGIIDEKEFAEINLNDDYEH